ncbi:hypothetical protein MHYP_G00119750 [Metynnis hypsauchen]
MLQQNNNNNSLCLDMAHRELLQGCGEKQRPPQFRSHRVRSDPFDQRPEGVGRQRRLQRQKQEENCRRTSEPKTKENLTFRTPGALVTVATLKGSEGVRQTQTRCLFLKAEGCSYLCTVGNNRPAGSRAAGSRINPNPAEGSAGDTYGSDRGRRAESR